MAADDGGRPTPSELPEDRRRRPPAAPRRPRRARRPRRSSSGRRLTRDMYRARARGATRSRSSATSSPTRRRSSRRRRRGGASSRADDRISATTRALRVPSSLGEAPRARGRGRSTTRRRSAAVAARRRRSRRRLLRAGRTRRARRWRPAVRARAGEAGRRERAQRRRRFVTRPRADGVAASRAGAASSGYDGHHNPRASTGRWRAACRDTVVLLRTQFRVAPRGRTPSCTASTARLSGRVSISCVRVAVLTGAAEPQPALSIFVSTARVHRVEQGAGTFDGRLHGARTACSASTRGPTTAARTAGRRARRPRPSRCSTSRARARPARAARGGAT